MAREAVVMELPVILLFGTLIVGLSSMGLLFTMAAFESAKQEYGPKDSPTRRSR